MPWAEEMPPAICAKCRNFDKVANPIEESDLFMCTNSSCRSVFCLSCLGEAPYCFRCGHLMRRIEAMADVFSVKADIRSALESAMAGHESTTLDENAPCILIVDDEPNILQLFKEIMPGMGFRVLAAESAEHGLRLAKEFVPDIIISDIMMPKIDGYEFLKRIRENPKISKIPFVALTGKTQDHDIFEGWKQGVDSYITKPFDLEKLVEELRNLIGL